MWQVIAARPRLTNFHWGFHLNLLKDKRGTSSGAIARQVVNNSPKQSKPRHPFEPRTGGPSASALLSIHQPIDKKPDATQSALSTRWNCACFKEVDAEMD
jgi:hypothetical protein